MEWNEGFCVTIMSVLTVDSLETTVLPTLGRLVGPRVGVAVHDCRLLFPALDHGLSDSLRAGLAPPVGEGRTVCSGLWCIPVFG